MLSGAGVLDRPAPGGADLHDDDVVACVAWRGGHIQASPPPGCSGNPRICAWIAQAKRTVSAENPLAVLTASHLARCRRC